MIASFNIVVAMKPLDGNFAQNAVKHGVAGLNIDGSRIEVDESERAEIDNRSGRSEDFVSIYGGNIGKQDRGRIFKSHSEGRFPANVLHDGSEEVVAGFPQTNKQAECKTDDKSGGQTKYVNGKVNSPVVRVLYLDEHNGGTAARFFKEIKEFET